jgi:uncharacterized coiled-coil protein SlyX
MSKTSDEELKVMTEQVACMRLLAERLKELTQTLRDIDVMLKNPTWVSYPPHMAQK